MVSRQKYRMPRQASDDLESECRAIYLSIYESTDAPIKSKDDLAYALQQTGRNPTQRAMQKHWRPSAYGMTFEDFVEVCRSEPVTTEDDLMKAFKKMDANGDGYISRKEFLKAMTSKGEKMTMDEVIEIIDKVDENKDGKLDYKEFSKLILSNVEECKKVAKEGDRRNRNERGSSAGVRSTAGRSTGGATSSGSVRIGSRSAPPKAVRVRELRGAGKIVRRGSFLLDETDNGSKVIVVNTYNMTVRERSKCVISLSPTEGLKLMDAKADLGVMLVQGNKVVAISECMDSKGRVALQCSLSPGQYKIIPITSGAKFKPRGAEAKTKAKLLKKDRDNKLALTTAFKDALTDIFAISDIDCNGTLSKEEFKLYILRTSGEELDDALWDVVKEHCKMSKGEILLEDYLTLNLKEAEDDEGQPDNLWVTLESMGFNKQLFMDEAFPFDMEVSVENGVSDLQIVAQDLENMREIANPPLAEYAKSKGFPFEGSDFTMHVLEMADRVLVVVDNESNGKLSLELNCKASTGLQGDLNPSANVRANKSILIMHLVPSEPDSGYAFTGDVRKK